MDIWRIASQPEGITNNKDPDDLILPELGKRVSVNGVE